MEKTTRLQDNKATSFFSDEVMWFFTEKQFREDSCGFVDVFLVMKQCGFSQKNNFVKIRVVSWMFF